MLVFLDLETTGLDPNKDDVLEVAAIVTDDQLNEIARFERVIWTSIKFHQLNPFVRDMHTQNGLWPLIAGGDDAASADKDLAAFIREHAVNATKDGKTDRPQLAGNTISFDRAFMQKHLPDAEAELHYRNLDISSLNEMSRRFFPAAYEARPKQPQIAHRAMADAEDSLRVARHYAKALTTPAAARFEVSREAADWLEKALPEYVGQHVDVQQTADVLRSGTWA
jgi:oligoribonuclease